MPAVEVAAVVANALKEKKSRNIIIAVMAIMVITILLFIMIIISLFGFLAPSDGEALESNKYYIQKEKIKTEYNINNNLNITYPQMLSIFTTDKLLESEEEINKFIVDNFLTEDEPDETIKDGDIVKLVSSEQSSDEDIEYSKTLKRFKYENEIQEMFRTQYNISEENILLAFSLSKFSVVTEIIDFGGNEGEYPPPVQSGRITTGYGNGIHPITHLPRFHNGIDIAGEWHQKVATIADGKVYKVNYNKSGYGNYVIIKHEIDGEIFYTLYAHLSNIYVYVDNEVKQGQVIGLEGGDPNQDPNPGNSTGHHLHFAVLKTPDGSESYNPNKYISVADR